MLAMDGPGLINICESKQDSEDLHSGVFTTSGVREKM